MLMTTQANNSKNNAHLTFSTKEPSISFELGVYDVNAPDRKAVEHFIKMGFQTAYHAEISITAPWLLAIKKDSFKAALGIRSAKKTLFIEQYLTESIEIILSKNNNAIMRAEIAEVCHLFSSSQKLTLPLLMTTAVALMCRDYKYMVFSGTQRVLELINKTGVVFTHLAEAKQEKLTDSSLDNNWGSYYETNPQVVAIELSSVLKTIQTHPSYQTLCIALEKKIAYATHMLVE